MKEGRSEVASERRVVLPRQVPAELRASYAQSGAWREETVAQLLAPHLEGASQEFRVWSDTRPEITSVGEVFDRARRFAGWLTGRDVGPGDVVAFQLPNWTESAVVFWGSLIAGATVAPVVHTYGQRELAYILNECAPKVLVVADRVGRSDLLSNAMLAQQDGSEVEWLVVVGANHRGRLAFDQTLSCDSLNQPIPTAAGSPVVVAYTSGTTNRPKGVIHTHETLGAELRQLCGVPQPDTRPVLVGSPVGHIAGMTAALGDAVLRQKAIHLADSWRPDRALNALRDGDLCLRGGAPYFIASLLDAPSFEPADMERMRFVRLGGAPVPRSLLRRLDRFGIVAMRMYGSTEHPSATSCRAGDPYSAIATDGQPLPGVEVAIRSADGSTQPVGEPGQIFTRGPDLAIGYTDAALTFGHFDADGWYATEDVGILDEEGQLNVVDRKGGFIIRGGENISVAEVEDCVLQHPSVAEVAVLSLDDERMGERAVAVVRCRPGESEVSLGAVRIHLQQIGLGRQKWPEAVVAVNEFPRTPSGKVDKRKLLGLIDDEAREQLPGDHLYRAQSEPPSRSKRS